MNISALVQQCAADVHPATMAAVVKVESGANPFAIGVVGGRLERQPRSKAEAISTAKSLERAGWNFSLGQAQVNRHNLAKHGLTYDSAFEPCPNLRAGAAILKECYTRALRRTPDKQAALHAALSCYYSGNFSAGFRQEGDQPSYVAKVLASAGTRQAVVAAAPLAVVPAVDKMAAVRAKAQERAEVIVGAVPVHRTAQDQPRKPRSNPDLPAAYDGFNTARESTANPYDGYAQQSVEPQLTE